MNEICRRFFRFPLFVVRFDHYDLFEKLTIYSLAGSISICVPVDIRADARLHDKTNCQSKNQFDYRCENWNAIRRNFDHKSYLCGSECFKYKKKLFNRYKHGECKRTTQPRHISVRYKQQRLDHFITNVTLPIKTFPSAEKPQ